MRRFGAEPGAAALAGFWLVALAELVGELLHLPAVILAMRPLLMPLLALHYVLAAGGWREGVHARVAGALVCSWAGDVLLLGAARPGGPAGAADTPLTAAFFLGGLGAFLAAQVFYIGAYRRAVFNAPPQPWLPWALPLAAYWAVTLGAVLPELWANPVRRAAAGPVALYATVLVGMAMAALGRRGRTTARSFRLTLAGACLFVVSDSLIAWNHLVRAEPAPEAGFLILSTYIAAQCLIVRGVLAHVRAAA